MPRFFVSGVEGESAFITGQDAVHIRRALRIKPGENLTLCDGRGTDYFCEVVGFEEEAVCLKVLYHAPTACEPDTVVTLYQGLPKGEKMEWILQKSVELGVTAVVPVITARSIVRLKPGEGEKKRERWQKIAAEAAGQSGRGIVPQVSLPLSFSQAAERLKAENTVVFYEGGGQPLSGLVNQATRSLSIVVGPEGGFETGEVELLREQGAHIVTLGKRILRCETAPLAALAVIMHLTGNLE